MNNGGDVLARGGNSAQFAAGGSDLTDFEADFIYKTVEEVMEKYGLTQTAYDGYSAARLQGDRLPDLRPVSEKQELDAGFSISDHRRSYMDSFSEAKVVQENPKKYPDPQFSTFTPILDRILIMRITDDPDEELLEDGSTRNKKTGLITAAKYRQHSNVGIVLATGEFTVMSGQRVPLSEFVQPGDKVTYGEYNAESFEMDEKKAEALCDALSVNYVKDPVGLWVVRIQDVRGVERKVRQHENHVWEGNTCLTCRLTREVPHV